MNSKRSDYDNDSVPIFHTAVMLSSIQRRREIIRLTESNDWVGVKSLAKQFAVSTATIRNDLNALGAKGLVVRSRGGAIASTPLTRELSVRQKYNTNLTTKRQLGQAVADLIGNDVRSVIVDSGTTTEEVVMCLAGRPGLQVMTNGLNIAWALSAIDEIEVMVTGGNLRRKSLSFYGPQAEESLLFLHFDLLILGADGIHPEVGVTTHFGPEANLNRLMRDVARKIILVADSSKIGRLCPHVICGLADVDSLVTDSGLSRDLCQTLTDQGIDLHVVDRMS